MERGIYAATSSGLLESKRLEVIANNIANANTVGFKASRLVSRQQEFSDTLASTLDNIPERAKVDQNHIPGVVNANVYTDFSAGPVRHTDAPLDAALVKENQFFVIQTDEGERYTRAGNFTLNAQGTLVTQDGKEVMGEGGLITLDSASPRISTNGSLISIDGDVLAKLRVVEIDDLNALVHEEGVRFRLEGGAARPLESADVVPQSLEMPNISIVSEMVGLISTQRAFEGYSKTVQTINEMNDTNLRTVR